MRLALTDPLTGLGNHRHFHERLQRELARGRGDGRRSSRVCLLDIDDFKQINDQLRPSRRRPRARAGRDAAAPGRRGVPARRRRVRACCSRASTRQRRSRSRGRSSSGIGEMRARPVRRDHGQRRRRDVPAARARARRADPARRRRALLGEGARQEPGARSRPDVVELAELEAARERRRPRRALPRRRLARRAPSTRATPTPAATPSASATRRRGSPSSSGCPPAEVELIAPRRAACTTSASSRSPRRSCASRAR